ncbi:hypothetical protein [Ideonella sp. YS5]|uniref:hypothetical protein n=1 Tax=Ideonella sp. YS5 TaxID=3453714 RepID=UPI003EEC4465
MQTVRLSLAALAACAALLAGCAVAPPDPEPVAQGQIPEPSMQKCATTTGSRIATTCSNLVKSTNNTAAVREMQRHIPMQGSN